MCTLPYAEIDMFCFVLFLFYFCFFVFLKTSENIYASHNGEAFGSNVHAQNWITTWDSADFGRCCKELWDCVPNSR